MGLEVSGVGIIAIVCSGCSARLYWYVIGDGPRGNRNKFSGPPSPRRALSGFDGLQCPVCGRDLSMRPRRIRMMTLQEFEDRFVVTDWQVLERKSIVEEQIETQTAGIGMEIDVAGSGASVRAENV